MSWKGFGVQGSEAGEDAELTGMMRGMAEAFFKSVRRRTHGC